MKDKNQVCNTHFKGVDGLGTCDTECDWYSEDILKELLKEVNDLELI